MELLALTEIKAEIDRRASRIGASGDFLPSYGHTRDFGYPHIEVDSRGYHYIVTERGIELTHIATRQLDELLYQVFEPVTHSLASRYEASHRKKGQDPRRQLFQYQAGLLAKLSPQWAERCAGEHARILQEHPFNDSL